MHLNYSAGTAHHLPIASVVVEHVILNVHGIVQSSLYKHQSLSKKTSNADIQSRRVFPLGRLTAAHFLITIKNIGNIIK